MELVGELVERSRHHGAVHVTPMPEHAWVYQARIIRVVDGDTCDVVIDAGFRATRTERLRLLGVNTPEVRGATKLAGDAATAFVKQWWSDAAGGDWPLLVQTEKSDVFGRYLALVWRRTDGACLNDALLTAGMAVPFRGG